MSIRKQALLRQHRRRKRVILIVLLIALLASATLALWLPLILAVALWIAHEAWFSDHLFYDPAQDYEYRFGDHLAFEVSIEKGQLKADNAQVQVGDTILLAVRLRAGWTGRLLDPGVLVGGNDLQAFERGARGVRFINLTNETAALAAGEPVALKGMHCRIDPAAQLLVFRQHDLRERRTMVIAPHADDAELAAFGLYSQSAQSWIVTLTAGEIEAEHYQAMGLSGVEAARLKGRLRAWDSVAVPLWAGVPRARCVQLGYFCLQLPAMREQPDMPVASREADLADVRPFRCFNEVALASDTDGEPTWRNLVADLRELIEMARPEVIVLPDPVLDPHPDHVAARQATLEAIALCQWQPQTLLHYANHLHDNDRWPMGPAGAGVALPPQFESQVVRTPWVLPLDRACQHDKAMALGMMHDLQPAAHFKRKLRRIIQQALAGRRWPAYGENEFFRKTVRRHELFWVTPLEGERD